MNIYILKYYLALLQWGTYIPLCCSVWLIPLEAKHLDNFCPETDRDFLKGSLIGVDLGSLPDKIGLRWLDKLCLLCELPAKESDRRDNQHGIVGKEAIRSEFKTIIDADWKKAVAEEDIVPTYEGELNDVYAPYEYEEIKAGEDKETIRFIDAISQSLFQSMQRHDNLVIMGQDIAEYGGDPKR